MKTREHNNSEKQHFYILQLCTLILQHITKCAPNVHHPAGDRLEDGEQSYLSL